MSWKDDESTPIPEWMIALGQRELQDRLDKCTFDPDDGLQLFTLFGLENSKGENLIEFRPKWREQQTDKMGSTGYIPRTNASQERLDELQAAYELLEGDTQEGYNPWEPSELDPPSPFDELCGLYAADIA